MDIFNAAATRLFDIILLPFAGFDPIWGLVFISLASGIIFLLLYGRFSNQRGLRSVKEQIHACILEAVLFRHDVGISLRAQGRMFRHGFLYVAYALPPLLVLMIPCVVILAQLQLRYDARPAKSGEPLLVNVAFDGSVNDWNQVVMNSSDVTLTPPVRMPDERLAVWRAIPKEGSIHELSLSLPDSSERVSMPVVTQDSEVIASGVRVPTLRAKQWWWAFLYPGEPTLPHATPVSQVWIAYPKVSYSILGVDFHWLVIFAIVSIATGLVASKRLGVEI